MLGDFDPSEVTFPPPSPRLRAGSTPIPVSFPQDEVLDYDAPYPAPRRAPRSWLKQGKPAKAPSKKVRLLALKRTVKTSLKLGRCPHALAEWRALAGSQLPGAKKAARQLKKTFVNKCMRMPRRK